MFVHFPEYAPDCTRLVYLQLVSEPLSCFYSPVLFYFQAATKVLAGIYTLLA
jgi:hypothetical protein